MLFTIEPGIYIEEEKMGIRIENNVWITEDGNVDLFEGIAITVEEIEAGMARKEISSALIP
jgi:Xaa-Pro aminopeptidase